MTDFFQSTIRDVVGVGRASVGVIGMKIRNTDRQDDIDVADACFGTEQELDFANGEHVWNRQNNGVFAEVNITQNVAGLIILRRPDCWKPISDYAMLLYINERHADYVAVIQVAFPIQQVIHYNMRPSET